MIAISFMCQGTELLIDNHLGLIYFSSDSLVLGALEHHAGRGNGYTSSFTKAPKPEDARLTIFTVCGNDSGGRRCPCAALMCTARYRMPSSKSGALVFLGIDRCFPARWHFSSGYCQVCDRRRSNCRGISRGLSPRWGSIDWDIPLAPAV